MAHRWYASTLSCQDWKDGDAVAPIPFDISTWSEDVQLLFQASSRPQYVIEQKDKTVDYEAMMLEYDA